MITQCMNKIFIALAFAFIGLSAAAMPARRGVARTLRLADGTEVRAELRGDEFARYYQDAGGNCYTVGADGIAVPADMAQLKAGAKRKRGLMSQAAQRIRSAAHTGAMRAPAFDYVGPGLTTGYTGKKRGLILLVQFPDKAFAEGHDRAFYEKVANQVGFSEGKFRGSVHDYYMDQSDGKFDLTFDVSRVLTAPNDHGYYGRNSMGSDARVGELVAWACSQVKDEYDFAQYDWDGDGYVDQVFVMYAGYGENSTDRADDIWPHMFYLSMSDYKQELPMGGVTVDRYACSCELNIQNEPDGIGTICHEFSHCLGFTDLYDTDYSGGYGMSSWDLMDYGGYNDNGYCPACYTGYEKWAAGWIEPKELTADTVVSGMKPVYEQGECYLVYNERNRNEFYFLDNRQKGGWDAFLPGEGLLVTHVDYDGDVWADNGVNNDAKHQRMTVFHADNMAELDDKGKHIAGFDAYPYVSGGEVLNSSLTDSSVPASTLYNYNYDAGYLMGKPLTAICQNADGTVGFEFGALRKTDVAEGTVVFSETFDQCKSKGGNDGIWNKGANGMLRADNDGWTSSKGYGANKCARFGSASEGGEAVSPPVRVPGDMTLTFKAAPWTGDAAGIEVEFEGKTVFSAEMTEGQWSEYSVAFSGDTADRLVFRGSGRFFLDDVRVVYNRKSATGVDRVPCAPDKAHGTRVYTIDGRYVGGSLSGLGKGLYIVNGKKIVK